MTVNIEELIKLHEAEGYPRRVAINMARDELRRRREVIERKKCSVASQQRRWR